MKDKNDPNDQKSKMIYQTEFELIDRLQSSLKGETHSPEELTEKLELICGHYRKLLNTTVKLTKLSDAYQKKLLLAKEDAEEKTHALEKAMAEIDTLSGLLPICSHCKQIRDVEGNWHQIETYIVTHSEAQFSHSLCPQCFNELYPDYSNRK